MPIIIDGWNLIRDHSSDISDDETESLESAKALISCLNDFQESHNDPIVLVFDSTHEYLDMHYENTLKLKIVPSRDADRYIKKFIENTPEKQRRNIRVVSSDKEIYFFAKSYSAVPIKCDAFWRKLRSYTGI
ncbi:MAG: NYN domain-containing protein [Candidatus Omnitrophica bacterium]|nr:NYN domain-containing protein [Candidatus Omnitrophota bacterium]